MLQLFNLSRFSAGFIAVLVGYTSSVAIILQAADTAGASAAQKSSWLWALGMGMAVSSIGLSLRYKKPVLNAWSTPGAALLVTRFPGLTVNQGVGAFLFSSLLIAIAGFSGGFAKIMYAIPRSLSSAMLAGVLLQFGLKVFTAMDSAFTLVGVMLLVYLFGRRRFPRNAIPLVFMTGLVVAKFQQSLHFEGIEWQLTNPVWMSPEFSWQVFVGVGLPLFSATIWLRKTCPVSQRSAQTATRCRCRH